MNRFQPLRCISICRYTMGPTGHLRRARPGHTGAGGGARGHPAGGAPAGEAQARIISSMFSTACI